MKKPDKAQLKAFALRILCMLGGNICYAVAVDFFLAGNNIAAGGLSGVAIIINSFVTVPIGLFSFIVSIPLFIWMFFAKDFKFMAMTMLSAVTYSTAVDLIAKLPQLTDDMMIASICGGIAYGVGAALLMRADCSDGGTDLLAKLLLTRFKNMSLGKMFMVVDGCIVVAAMIVFKSFESGFYAILTLGICSYVTDLLIRGVNRAEVFYIITGSDPEPLARAIMEGLDRGVTCQKATGMYRHTERNILMVVVKTRQVYKLKDIVKRTDPTAFMFLSSASEVLGEGFGGIDANKVEENALIGYIRRKRESKRQQR